MIAAYNYGNLAGGMIALALILIALALFPVRVNWLIMCPAIILFGVGVVISGLGR